MLVPFEMKTLEQTRFIKYCVQFNLLYRISEGACATSLRTEDGGAVALQSVGRGMWLWIDPEMGAEYAASVVEELSEHLKDSKLPSVTASPENAALFARIYCHKSGAAHKLSFNLMAYACPEVKMPRGVPGGIIRAEEKHTEIVAEFISGFEMDIFGTAEEDREKNLVAAANRIKTNDLFLWVVDGKTVSMAAIGHRSPRHARVNSVYTPPEERRKGYASAVVAAVSQKVLDEGLIPVLYTDLANPDSNKVYCSIGYKQAGAADEIGFFHGV